MTKQDYTHLTLVVDRSGSMVAIREDAQGGVNTMISEQAKEPGEITVTLFQFDTEYNKVFGPIAASEAPEYQLTPRGSTALLDATGRAIVETGEFLSGLAEDQRPEKVIFVVATDGLENASQEYTREKIKEMVARQTNDYQWEFIYLGANVDAFGESRSLGFAGSSQYAATADSTRAVYGNASSAISNARNNKVSVTSNLVDVDDQGNTVSQEQK